MQAWTDKRERLPTEADADPQNCVLVWHRYNGVMVTGYHQVSHNGLITHWMPVPEPPYHIKRPEEDGNGQL